MTGASGYRSSFVGFELNEKGKPVNETQVIIVLCTNVPIGESERTAVASRIPPEVKAQVPADAKTIFVNHRHPHYGKATAQAG